LTYRRHIAGVLALASLAGCSGWSLGLGRSSRDFDHSDVIERSTLKLDRPPLRAGECIVENARAQGSHAQLVPLYGLESVAVTVKTETAGDIIAVFAIATGPSGTAAQTTTWAGVQTRDELLKKLTQGC
jgi:hypothetical protein